MQNDKRTTEIIRDVLVSWLMLRWIEQEAPVLERSDLGKMCVVAVFEPIYHSILQQMNRSKRELKKSGTYVISQHISETDIEIQYKESKLIHQATYPLAILFADVKAGVLQRLKEDPL